MKKWKNIKKSHLAAALTVVLVAGAGVTVLLNASSLNRIFEPRDFERFENEHEDGSEFDSVSGDGEESDLADEHEDGRDHADEDVQKALRVAEDESGDRDRPGLADDRNHTGSTGREENPDAFEIVDNQGIGGIDVRPGDGNHADIPGSGGNTDGNGSDPSVPGSPGNSDQTGKPGGTERPGTSDKPDRPGKPEFPWKPGEPDSPDDPDKPDIPVNWEEEQLKPRDPVQTEHGTLMRLSAVIHRDYYQGDVFQGEDATVTAVFLQGGSSREITVPYGGPDGYSVQLSTQTKGRHTATFTYKGVTARAQYEVISSEVSVFYYGENGGNIYAISFPGPITADELPSISAASGGRADLTDVHSRLIAYLGDRKIEAEFKKDHSYSNVVFLREQDGYLTTMLSGFRYYSNGALAEDGGPYLYYPITNWGAITRHVVDVVTEVPEGYKIIRSVSNGEDLNRYRGEQVLKGYTGNDTVLRVPAGVTKISLEGTQGNGAVTSMVLPESVSVIDFESITRCLPELESYEGQGAGNYQAADGALYSRDGSTLISVPPGKKELQIPDTVTTIAGNAFLGSRIRELTIPGTVTRLEEDCLKGFAGDVIRIKGQGNLSVGSDTGYRGKVLFEDSVYDILLKRGMAAFQSEAVSFGAMDESGAEIPGKTGIYRYDSKRGILTLAGEPETLAGILPGRYGYYRVPAGITEIGEAAFAGADSLREIELPDTVRRLRDGSLALLENVRRILVSSKNLEISPMIFGDPAAGANVPKLEICVPREAYQTYLTRWSQVLDPVYGRGTARRLLAVNDDTVFYEDEAKYQKIVKGGKESYRLLTVYAQNQTAFKVKDQTSEIGEGAFADCGMLEIVYLPDTVNKIGAGAFAGCGKLQTVTAKAADIFPSDAFDPAGLEVRIYEKGDRFAEFVYDEGMVYGRSGDGIYTLLDVPTDRTADVAVYQKTGYLNEEAFKDCTALSRIEIPDQGALIEIGDRCFENCRAIGAFDLSKAAGLGKIGEGAFRSCTGLTSLILPGCVGEIPGGMCYDCSALETVEAKGAAVIGDEAFYNCVSLKQGSLSLGWDQITAVGDRAFAYCVQITEFPDMNSLESLGIQTFFSCQRLGQIVLPETLTSMGEECFGECGSLTRVMMNGKLTGISRYCFYGCRELISVEFGEQQREALQLIGVQAFGHCTSLENLDLGNFPGLKQMGERTFLGCDALTTVKMPEYLEKVPDYCFEECQNLSILTLVSGEVTKLGSAVFGDRLSPYLNIWVRQEKLADYEAEYTEILDQLYGEGTAKKILGMIDNGREIIRGVVFELTDGGKILKEVTDVFRTSFTGSYTVPKETVRIEADAFAGCSNITGVVLPAGSRISLGDRCFKACPGLETVELYGDIPEWGMETFMDCTALKEVNIGRMDSEEITRIGTRAFAGCTGLSDRESAVSFGTKISVLGEECFAGCTNLQAIPLTEKARLAIEVIEDRAFAGCTSLTQFLTSTFSNVRTIGNYVFTGCDSLRNPSVPKGVTSIGEGCFADCKTLTTVSFYCVLEEYPKDCFKNCPSLTRTGGVAAALGGLRRIGDGAYEGCTSLTTNASWNLGRYSGLEEIGVNSFRGCTGMTEIAVPATVKRIGAGAFDGLSGVGKITFQSKEVPEMGAWSVDSAPAGFEIRVPDSQTENDSVYKAYLAVFGNLFGEDRAYEVLDSMTDGAKGRNPRSIVADAVRTDGTEETGEAEGSPMPAETQEQQPLPQAQPEEVIKGDILE